MMFGQKPNSHRIFKRQSVCAYTQAGLSLRCSHILHCWKSHVTAQMDIFTYMYAEKAVMSLNERVGREGGILTFVWTQLALSSESILASA